MLTAREREILQLLADGMSNADAAAKLFISQETVKSHVRHILTKLEADTRTHAVAIALRDAIIDYGRPAPPDDARAALQDRLIAAEQDERRRIALFLHDGPVQSLSGIALMLDAVSPSLEAGKLDEARAVLEQAADPAAADDPRAARPLLRARAGRPPRPGLRRRDQRARRAGRPRPRAANRARRRRGRPARRAGAGRPLHDHPRVARARDQARPADCIAVRDLRARGRQRRGLRRGRRTGRAAAPRLRGDRGARPPAARTVSLDARPDGGTELRIVLPPYTARR